MGKRYAGYLFDADNTLFDYGRAETEALRETLLEEVGPPRLEEALLAYQGINTDLWRELEQGRISIQHLKVQRFRALLARLGALGAPDAVSARYIDNLAQKHYLMPHAREVLSALGVRASLCLVTNGISAIQRSRVEKACIREHFSAILVSEEQGVSKPDARFFTRAAAALGLPPSELLCVGDNPVADILGAMHAGFDACWLAPGPMQWPYPAETPHLCITSLDQLLSLAC